MGRSREFEGSPALDESLPISSRIVRALAEPDPNDPTGETKRYPTDEDVVKVIFAKKLMGLEGERLDREIVICKSEIATARRRFTDNLIHLGHRLKYPLALIRNDAIEIRHMYPGSVVNDDQIVHLLRRPDYLGTNLPSLPADPTASQSFSSGFSLLDHLKGVEEELRQTPLGTRAPHRDFSYGQLESKQEL